jgi:hypothetical protein
MVLMVLPLLIVLTTSICPSNYPNVCISQVFSSLPPPSPHPTLIDILFSSMYMREEPLTVLTLLKVLIVLPC